MGCGRSAELFENAGVFTDDDINRKVTNALSVSPNKIRADKERLLEYIYFLFLRRNYEIILKNIRGITASETISQKQSVNLTDITVLMSFLTVKLQKLMEQEKEIEKEKEIIDIKLRQFEIKISEPNSQMIDQLVGQNFNKKVDKEAISYQSISKEQEEPEKTQRTVNMNAKQLITGQTFNITHMKGNKKKPKDEESISAYTPTEVYNSFMRASYSYPDQTEDLKADIEDQGSELANQREDFIKDRIQGLQIQIRELNKKNEYLIKQVEGLKFENKLLQEKNRLAEEKESFASTNDSKLTNAGQITDDLKKQVENLQRQLTQLSEQRSHKLGRLGIIKGDEISIFNYKKTPAVLENPSFIQVDSNQQVELQGQPQSFKTDRSMSIMFNLFSNSKILPNHKQFQKAVGVRQILAEMFSEKVKSTDLLYAYDPINPLHYEKYIKTAEDVMLLIQLPNDYIIGGFAGKVEGNKVAESFIFSLNPHRTPIKLTPQSKISRINKDSSYLSFGFDEISIKAKTLSVVCNVNGFRTMFSQKGRNVHIETFLGFEKREFTAQAFQIYQINFKGIENLNSVII